MSKTMFFAVAFAAALVVAPAAIACSCVRVDRATVLGRAEVAFRGEIETSRPSADGRSIVARVRVVRMIKGEAPSFVTVTSVAVPGLCGYPLIVGAELDFAGRFDGDGHLAVNMCGMVPLNPRPRPGPSPK